MWLVDGFELKRVFVFLSFAGVYIFAMCKVKLVRSTNVRYVHMRILVRCEAVVHMLCRL